MNLDPLPRPLIEGEFGLIILPLGIVKIREHCSFYERVLSGDAVRDGDPERIENVQIAVFHEVVHQVQSITTSWGFLYSEDIRVLLSQFLSYAQGSPELKELLPPAREAYSHIVTRLNRRTGSSNSDSIAISANDLLEDMAVIESLRASGSLHSPLDILRLVPTNPSSNYGKILGIVLRELGPVPAQELTSTICFLALSAVDHGVAFNELIARLRKLPASQVQSLTDKHLIEDFAPDLSASTISQSAAGKNISQHPLWNRIAQTFAASGNLLDLHRCAANPSWLIKLNQVSARLDQNKAGILCPLITMFEDGRAKISPHLPEEEIAPLLATSSMTGAMLRVLDNKPPFVACKLSECPVHRTGLCHYHYPPSPDSDWRECSFHQAFSMNFKKTPVDFFEELKTIEE